MGTTNLSSKRRSTHDQLRPESEAKEKHSAQERYFLDSSRAPAVQNCSNSYGNAMSAIAGVQRPSRRGAIVTSLIQNNEPKLRQDIEDIMALIRDGSIPDRFWESDSRISHDSFNNTRLKWTFKSGKLLKNLLILETK